MSRSVEEWIGKTDDAVPPPRVRLRVLGRFNGRCAECGREIPDGEVWTCDHTDALINGGENRESNLRPLCKPCTPAKDRADVAIKSKTADMAKTRSGVRDKRPWSPIWKRKLNGKTVRR